MVKLRLKTAKFVGASVDDFWPQVHIFSPHDEEKLKKRGHLFAALSLKQKPGETKQLGVWGKELISRLHEEYFGNLQETAFERLKKAVEKVAREINNQLSLEMVVVVLTGKVVYVVVKGEGQVVLRRKEKVGIVCQGKNKELESCSGFLKNGDLFLLGTGNFFKDLAFGSIKAGLMTGSVKELIEVLSPMIYGKAGLEKGSAVAVRVRFFKKGAFQIKKKTRKKRTPGFLLSGLKAKITMLCSWLKGVKTPFKRSPGSLRRKTKKKGFFLRIVVVFGLLFGASLFLGVYNQEMSRQHQGEAQILQEAEGKLKKARGLVELNPIRAEQLLGEVENLVGQLPDKDRQKVNETKQEIKDLILRRNRIAELPVFYDLEILKKEGRGDGLVLVEDKLMILDTANGVIYSLEVDSKKGQIWAGGQVFEGATEIAAANGSLLVAVPEGIIKKTSPNQKEAIVINNSDSFRDLIDFEHYQSNLYFLKKDTLYYCPGTSQGFGSARGWLEDDEKLPGGVVSMAIDGSIWVTTQGGQIIKFLRGKKEPFRVTGLVNGQFGPILIYTDANREKLYLLDEKNSRLVILEKNGNYYSQYVWGRQVLLEDFAVSEKKGKIWLLGGNKIYEINIKN